MKVYHGSTLVVQYPLAGAGRDNLDFGKGFYVTDIYNQAQQWAAVIARRLPNTKAVVNIYELDLDKISSSPYKTLRFNGYCSEWLDFIVDSRRGAKPWLDYDMIEGGVANDRVFDTIENYIGGGISKEVALGCLRYEKPNNQFCLLNQQLIDECLSFEEYITIE